jgi:hypothetical protein
MTEGTSKGYWGGGFTGLSSWTTRTDKISFSTDTSVSQTTADLSAGRDRYQSVSDGSSKGYFAGGQTGSHLSICDKVTFATDVTVAQTTITLARIGGSGMSNGINGLALGGIDLTGLSKSANKLAFATDSISALGSSSDLSTARTGVTGCSMAAL